MITITPTRTRTRIVSAGLFATALALVGCSSDESSSATTAAPTPSIAETTAETAETADSAAATVPAVAGATMTISEFTFSALTVPAGATITINNNDPAPHTVTADDDSFSVDVGTSAELVIPAAGTYAIHCEIHPSMQGTIIVE